MVEDCGGIFSARIFHEQFSATNKKKQVSGLGRCLILEGLRNKVEDQHEFLMKNSFWF